MKYITKWKKLVFVIAFLALFTGCTGTTYVSTGHGVYGGYGYPSYGYSGGYYRGGYSSRRYRSSNYRRLNRPNRYNRAKFSGHRARPGRPSRSMRRSHGRSMRRR